MSRLKRGLALVMTLCMMLSMVPMAAPKAQAAESDEFLKVFHLDCGRKYFSVDQVKELIDAISNVGYSHMELAIGNDGLRLLLDDMDIEANGTTYNGETIKAGIQSGNAAYSHSGEWLEDDMDDIIAYAKTKGIEIIPLVNNPGHMDSILAAMSACELNGNYKTSARTVDLENEDAVAFTQALVMKYAEYFASKGCEYFNIGADEYANDYHTNDQSGMGFGYLIDNNKYGNFITYVNTLVGDICALGMTPIAFNDGIYFRENTSFGTFDDRLMIAAWSGGWGGIKPASTTFLQNKGHQILNTNERWYYVLGRAQSANSTYCYESALSNAQSESVTTVTDHKDGVTSVGAMQCVWCDDPAVNYETYKSKVMTLISTFAESNPTYFTGPNVVVPETVTKTDETTGISASAPGLSELIIEQIEGEANLPVIEGVSEILAYDVQAFAGDESYTGETTISIPVPAEWTRVRGGVLASASGEEVLGIEGKLEKGMFTFTVPHLSEVVVYASKYDEEITLQVGETAKSTVEDQDLTGTHTPEPEGIATVDVIYTQEDGKTIYTEGDGIPLTNTSGWSDTGVIKSGEYYLVMNGTKLSATTDIAEATVFTITRSSSSRWTIKSGNYYLRYSNSALSFDTNSYEWRYSDGFCRDNYSNYLICSNGNWNASGYYWDSPKTYLYDVIPNTTPAIKKSVITFTGVAPGETYVTIVDTTYKIVVSKKELSEVITVGTTKTYSDSSTTAPVVADPSIVEAEINNGTLTITALKAGTTTVTTGTTVYTINTIEFDPTTVDPLTVEYWITNLTTRTVESTTDNPVITQQISAAVVGVATEAGADIDAMMPKWTIKKDGDSGADREVEFWHVRLLDKTKTNNSASGTEEQTTQSADDETTSGDAVTRVRYYDPGDGNGRRWQLLADSVWMDVTDDNQIVAYYMEVVYIQNGNDTTELHVNAADWGKMGDGSPASSYADTSKYCSISLQIIYEDGSSNPAGTTAGDLDSKTLIFNYWDNGRGIGTFAFDSLGQFDIYQITAETGAVAVSFSGGAWGTAQVTNFTWDNNEKVVWTGDSERASVYNNTSNPSKVDPKDNLMWNENKEAILLRVYVRAIETEDSLSVVYVDETFDDTLYSYNIQVDANRNFNKNMVGTAGRMENGRINVTGCGIVNSYGQTQNFQTDLSKVPEAQGKYNSGLYDYTGSEISADGKTLYLYYKVNPNILYPKYVVDFGLPISFGLEAIVGQGVDAAVGKLSAKYGALTYNEGSKTFTYTPTKVIHGVDVLSIPLTMEGTTVVHNVGVIPATTVYYEEGFLLSQDATGWEHTAVTLGNQQTAELGDVTDEEKAANSYGYDETYASVGTNSGFLEGGAGASTTFTFTGTGFQLYANSKDASGYVTVYSQGEISKLYMINTELRAGDTDATNQQRGDTYYNLPIISETDLPHGQYTVQIKQTKGNDPIYIDGVRIINTLKDSTTFTVDEEDNPDFYELRDCVLNAVGVSTSDYVSGEDSSDRVGLVDAVENMAGQVYNHSKGAKAIILDENLSYANSGTAQDLLDNGPKNELYLYPKQTLAFKVTTDRVMQLGLKAPAGSAEFTLTVDGKTLDLESLSTTVDMFYKIADKAAQSTTHTVSITVSEGVLSVTNLKVCDDPNFTFSELTKEDIENVLLGMNGLLEDETSKTTMTGEYYQAGSNEGRRNVRLTLNHVEQDYASVIIVTQYNNLGMMKSLQMVPHVGGGTVEVANPFFHAKGDTYRAFMLDAKTQAPVCPAVSLTSAAG